MDLKVEILKEKLLKTLSKEKMNIIASIVDKKKPISLRTIEWFVSNYSKKHKVVYKLNGVDFNVYSSYKDEQLTSYNKKMFDMYRRMEKFTVPLGNKKSFETTVAQLNFFRWVFKNNILQYIEENLTKIKKDLELSSKIKKTIKKTTEKFFEDIQVSKVNISISFA